jgi:hypothetical protein
MNYNNDKLTESMVVTIGVIIVTSICGFLGLLYGVFAGGFVGMKLWTWFIVPVFGAKALTIVQAWGIALLVSLWTHQTQILTNKDEREPYEKILALFGMVINPWIVLLIGWAGKSLFM